MKIRLLDNSVRVRLRKSEVRELLRDGVVRRTTRFSADQELIYQVRTESNAVTINASFDCGVICIELPRVLAVAWATTTQVGMHADSITDHGIMSILIEKDFPCAHHTDDAPGDKFTPDTLVEYEH